MTPTEVRADYRRALSEHGETVALRREAATAVQTPNTIRVRVMGFTPQELASGIDQGSRKVIMLAEDVEAAIAANQWPAPAAGKTAILKGDRIMLRGAPKIVQSVDDSTRRIGGVLAAYELVATGF